MGVIDNLLAPFVNRQVGKMLSSLKASSQNGPQILPWNIYTFNTPSFYNLVREGYRSNGAVFACISALAFAFPEPPLQVMEESDQGAFPVKNHPLLSLLKTPNPLMSQADLIQHTIVYLAIGGNCYWYKVRRNNIVTELWPLHDGMIKPIMGKNSVPTHFEFINDNLTAEQKRVETADVVHFKWMPDPLNTGMGLSPLVAVAREVDVDNEIGRYVFNLLKNDAIPRLAMIFPKEVSLDDDSYLRVKAEWNQRQGGENRGGVGIVEGGADLKVLALNLKDLEFNVLRRVPEARLTAAFRVPAIVAGVNVGLENSTYSNFKEAITLFTERTLVPLWGSVGDKVTMALLKADFHGRDDNVVLFDITKVVALADQTAAQRAWAGEALAKGGITKNEYRAAYGMPRDERGDVYLMPMSLVEVPAYTAPGMNGGPPDPKALAPLTQVQRSNPTTNLMSLQTKANRPTGPRIQTLTQLINTLRQLRRKVEPPMVGELDLYFAHLADEVVGRLKTGAKGTKGPQAEDLLKPSDGAALQEIVRRYYTEVIELSWTHWNVALGIEMSFDLTDPAVTKALALCGDRITEIHQTTLDAVREVMQYGSANGWSIADFARGRDGRLGLRAVVTETYRNRARTIARTEMGTAQNAAAANRFEGAGVKRVLVLDNGATDDDDECKRLNGTIQTVAWAKDPKNHLQHPNCTRAIAPYVEDGIEPSPKPKPEPKPKPVAVTPPPPPAEALPVKPPKPTDATSADLRQQVLAYEVAHNQILADLYKATAEFDQVRGRYDKDSPEYKKASETYWDLSHKWQKAKDTKDENIQKILRPKYTPVTRVTNNAWDDSNGQRIKNVVVDVMKLVSQKAAGGLFFDVKLQKTSNARAFARPDKGEVHLSSARANATTAHEVAHLLEKNKDILNDVVQFRTYRAKGEKPTWLGRGYELNEIAIRDKFFNAYVGKVYSGNPWTEVMSMGVEKLYTDPIGFAKLDPEYFDFVVDMLHGRRWKRP